jgi:hypothetical protein
MLDEKRQSYENYRGKTMKKTFCDVKGCEEEAEKEVDVCTGWLVSRDSRILTIPKEEFKPFERPTVRKRDLCSKHLREWCKATYESLYGKIDEIKEEK